MPMKAVKKKKKSVLLRLACIGFGVYVAVSLVQLQMDIGRSKESLAQVNQQIQEQTLKNQELQAMIDAGEDKAEIERIARELGYVFSDEQVVILANGN